MPTTGNILVADDDAAIRTVVREAIKSLVAKGLVVTGPKVGTRVLPQDEWSWFDPSVIAWQARNGLSVEFLQDLQELRRVVEPAAVRMAAERAETLWRQVAGQMGSPRSSSPQDTTRAGDAITAGESS